MTDRENDENIRVNIRTGTSTRVPCPRNRENHTGGRIPYLEADIMINFDDVTDLLTYSGLLEQFLMTNSRRQDDVFSRSMEEYQFNRNPRIRLDIIPHSCKNMEVDMNCSVCQEKFKLGENLSTLEQCNHTFHYQCLQEWGKYKQECPLCRSVIPILER